MSLSSTKKLTDPHRQAPGRASKAAGEPNSTPKTNGKNNNHLPERYIVKSSDNDRVLICLEAPSLNVHVEAGLSISGSMVRKSPPGTIFLDGVAQSAPFMDHERQIYNLDHHEGCVRAFTLATCEQALVMYMKGLDLKGREWNIFANEPDLDTILAIWIILNHDRIGRQEATQRRLLFALVRYEGVVDALGLELKELTALSPELVRKIQRVIDHLRSEEITLKKDGRWADTDYLAHTVSILHKIDQIFFKPQDFEDYQDIEELARIDLTEKRIAAVVEVDMGIYEVEPHLNKLYGGRLGVVFLKKGPGTYTVRLMDLFMPIALEDIYERLNFVDPAVKCRTQANKWGGADDIGGSPRETGTLLTPAEIVQACRDAAKPLSKSQQAYRFAVTAALVSFIALIAYIIGLHWNPGQWLGRPDLSPLVANPKAGFIITLLALTIISLLFTAYCRPWQYGWIAPSGRKWWFILPAVIVAGAAGGVWAPAELLKTTPWHHVIILYGIGMPLVCELLFRSLTHGMLTQNARIQRSDTHWFMSWPNLGSAILYTGFMILLTFGISPEKLSSTPWLLARTLAAAVFFSLALGMTRERSNSLYPAILFHALGAFGAILIIKLILA